MRFSSASLGSYRFARKLSLRSEVIVRVAHSQVPCGRFLSADADVSLRTGIIIFIKNFRNLRNYLSADADYYFSRKKEKKEKRYPLMRMGLTPRGLSQIFTDFNPLGRMGPCGQVLLFHEL